MGLSRVYRYNNEIAYMFSSSLSKEVNHVHDWRTDSIKNNILILKSIVQREQIPKSNILIHPSLLHLWNLYGIPISNRS